MRWIVLDLALVAGSLAALVLLGLALWRRVTALGAAAAETAARWEAVAVPPDPARGGTGNTAGTPGHPAQARQGRAGVRSGPSA